MEFSLNKNLDFHVVTAVLMDELIFTLVWYNYLNMGVINSFSNTLGKGEQHKSLPVFFARLEVIG